MVPPENMTQSATLGWYSCDSSIIFELQIVAIDLWQPARLGAAKDSLLAYDPMKRVVRSGKGIVNKLRRTGKCGL